MRGIAAPPGDYGDIGLPGPSGPKGEKGSDGEYGSMGDKGPRVRIINYLLYRLVDIFQFKIVLSLDFKIVSLNSIA